MCAGRGCRGPHGEGDSGWLPGPLRRVAIRRRGTRTGECGGRGINHLGVGALDRAVVLARVVAPALAALLDPEDDDDNEHRRQVEHRLVPVAGVGERDRGHGAHSSTTAKSRGRAAWPAPVLAVLLLDGASPTSCRRPCPWPSWSCRR